MNQRKDNKRRGKFRQFRERTVRETKSKANQGFLDGQRPPQIIGRSPSGRGAAISSAPNGRLADPVDGSALHQWPLLCFML